MGRDSLQQNLPSPTTLEDQAMSMNRRQAIQLIAAVVPAAAAPAAFSLAGHAAGQQATSSAPAAFGARKFTFDGVYSELRISMKELGLDSPADLSPYSQRALQMTS